LFPYTTLFRSADRRRRLRAALARRPAARRGPGAAGARRRRGRVRLGRALLRAGGGDRRRALRRAAHGRRRRVRVERRPRRAARLRPAGGPHGLLRVAMAGAGRHRPWRSRDAAAAGAPRSAGAQVTIVDVVVAILMLAGLVGAILPFLPGAPVIFAGPLLYALATDFTPIGAGRLAILAEIGRAHV